MIIFLELYKTWCTNKR